MSEAPSLEAIAKLAPVLATEGAAPRAITALSGGASQDLWLIEFGDRRVVLRRAPDGRARSDLAVPIEQEAALMTRAHEAGVPTPRVLYVLKPSDGLGAGFFMEHVAGEALGQRIVKHEAFAGVRPKLARQCGEILAAIHRLPISDGLPVSTATEIVDALERQHRLERWPRPVFELAFRWLRENLPPPSAPVAVHGDFRTGNLLIDGNGVRAVLDWELAHAGDPMEDLGWLCVNSWRFGAIDKPVGGFGTRDELYESYETAGGRAVSLDHARFWEVLGTLRWGVICTMSGVALRDGAVEGVERAMIARRASETELDLLNLLEER